MENLDISGLRKLSPPLLQEVRLVFVSNVDWIRKLEDRRNSLRPQWSGALPALIQCRYSKTCRRSFGRNKEVDR
jgi:hypothetical protein